MSDFIHTPVNYCGMQLKNRIIFAPTTMGMGEKAWLEKLRQIAEGGCAMIIIGDVPVGEKGFFTLYSKRGAGLYQRMTDLLHQYDCKVCAQLHQSDTHFGGMWKYLPAMLTGKIKRDELKELMNEGTGEYISSIPANEVRSITASFGAAAVQAKKLGFDMVQVHGDRMCGSFSSSLFNHRTDAYGGSAVNRARFGVECVSAIREALPDLPIDYKMAVRQEDPHYGNAGVLVEELGTFVPMLEAAGVTSFHVTLADHSKLEDPIPPANHPYFSEQGCFLRYCDEVRKFTTLPVCGGRRPQ